MLLRMSTLKGLFSRSVPSVTSPEDCCTSYTCTRSVHADDVTESNTFEDDHEYCVSLRSSAASHGMEFGTLKLEEVMNFSWQRCEAIYEAELKLGAGLL